MTQMTEREAIQQIADAVAFIASILSGTLGEGHSDAIGIHMQRVYVAMGAPDAQDEGDEVLGV